MRRALTTAMCIRFIEISGFVNRQNKRMIFVKVKASQKEGEEEKPFDSCSALSALN